MFSVGYSKNRLSRDIFLTLRDRIVYLEYAPETVLSEKELCAEFKVSRTPLREAILKLEDMNLVRSIARFGTYVTHIDTNELRSTYEVKIHLEPLAGILAAQRITEEELNDLENLTHDAVRGFKKGNIRKMFDCDFQFHEAIWRASRNPVLEGILVNIHARCLRFCNATIPASTWELRDAEEFGTIYESIKNRDTKRAAELLEDHNQQIIDLIRKHSLDVGNNKPVSDMG
jgi:DNA-binding GntR family transcriptional regulator